MNRQPIDAAQFAAMADYFAYDETMPLAAEVIGTWRARSPYLTGKVTYASARGVRVPAFFAHPAEAVGGPHAAILLLHGANDFWGKHEDWAVEWYDILAREGWCVLCADSPGHGERKRAGELGPQQLGPYAWRDLQIQTTIDQRRGIDYLLSREEVDPRRVALLGGSLGGYHGIRAAALEQRLAAIVLTVTTSWPLDKSTDDPVRRFGHTLNFAPRIQAPLLMVNATGDGRDGGEELFAAASEPKEQIWYESSHFLPPREYSQDILKWLHEHLA